MFIRCMSARLVCAAAWLARSSRSMPARSPLRTSTSRVPFCTVSPRVTETRSIRPSSGAKLGAVRVSTAATRAVTGAR